MYARGLAHNKMGLKGGKSGRLCETDVPCVEHNLSVCIKGFIDLIRYRESIVHLECSKYAHII
jgi:hypothetical protein